MQPKAALLSLLSIAALAEASTLRRDRTLMRRQNGFGGGGNGGNGGGNFNFQNGNNGGNNGGANAGDNTGGNNNGGNNNGGNNNGGNNNGGNNNGGNNNGGNNGANNGGNNGANDNAANNGGNNNNNNGGGQACLNQDALQTASAQTGQNGAAADGQVASATDEANFINFCSGKTVTNGLQVQEGSCNGIVMGDIPSTSRMTSIVLLSPQHDDRIPADQTFDITLQSTNLIAGSFTNPQETYYSAPQQLSGGGEIIGHVHVTVQDLGGSLNPSAPLDASQFAFFKGINDDGDGNGKLTATVEGGLPSGNYRVCTIAAAMNHQPVLMPVAQRGAQDDCSKFTVE